eukprot:CAMPEP_0170968136 /NCGR_PEP_ID=MMETSP0735-20130129/43076_1 /TAXON_ID=186038 /ORGANISM="Fragilariopsis kerguelensis, Strain L26-C5" /LENGTH=201 /DNA_ID=CAMNT_0011387103 /DNA_START=146 /DNA_END=748 /DNA_ORIENTATION=+
MTITTGVVQVVDARRLGVGVGGGGGEGAGEGVDNNQKLVRIVGGTRPHHYSSSSRENNKIEEMEITLQKYRIGSRIIDGDKLKEPAPEPESESEPEHKEENTNNAQSHHNRHRSLSFSFSLLWANTFIDTVRQEIESMIENTHLLSVMPLRRSLSSSLRSSSSSQSQLHGSNSNSTNRQSSTHRSLYQAWARDSNGKILWW